MSVVGIPQNSIIFTYFLHCVINIYLTLYKKPILLFVVAQDQNFPYGCMIMRKLFWILRVIFCLFFVQKMSGLFGTDSAAICSVCKTTERNVLFPWITFMSFFWLSDSCAFTTCLVLLKHYSASLLATFFTECHLRGSSHKWVTKWYHSVNLICARFVGN